MNKAKISKIIVLIITFTLLTCISTTVRADDAIDLTNSLTGGNSTTGNETTGNETTGNNTTGNETTGNNTTGNNTTNNVSNKNNTSTYKESDIPYAGPETSILMGAAFVVCGAIGVYTFMKLSDYSNI